MTDLTQHWRRTYESKYLGAWDLYDKTKDRYIEVTARIDRITQDEVIGEGGRKSYPWQLHLSGSKGPIKVPMIVSKTSGKTLEIMFGERPSEWVGKSITLYVRKEKKVRKGTGSVLVIRNTKGSQDLRDELQERRGPAIDEGDFDEPEKAEAREPGEEG
jgi:hypothetical protein